MKNIFFDHNDPMQFHVAAFLLTVFVMILIGVVFLQISSCRMADYMYTSQRLNGSQSGFICKIF